MPWVFSTSNLVFIIRSGTAAKVSGFSIPSRGSHLTDCLSEGGGALGGGLALLVLILIVRVLVVLIPIVRVLVVPKCQVKLSNKYYTQAMITLTKPFSCKPST